jgi:hypothetical protein
MTLAALSVWAISGLPALHRPLPRRRGDGGRTLAQGSAIRPLADTPVALADRHKRIKIDLERAGAPGRTAARSQTAGRSERITSSPLSSKSQSPPISPTGNRSSIAMRPAY